MSIDDKIDGGIYAMGVRDGRQESLEITTDKDAEIAALKAELEENAAIAQGLANLLKGERDLLKGENERLMAGIGRAKQIIIAENIHPQSMHFANSVMLALTPPQPTEEKPKPTERQRLKEQYATLTERIEALGPCYASDKMEETKAQIMARLDEIGWNEP